MSLITRCTACGTLFKVVADQLKISDGWVRCGQCHAVFDANANLVPTDELAHIPDAIDSIAADAANKTGSDPFADSSWINAVNLPAGFTQSSNFEPSQASTPPTLHELEELARQAPPKRTHQQAQDNASATDRALKVTPAEALKPMPSPEFILQAQRAQRWRSPAVRVVLGFVGLCLILVLAVQVLVYERERIAALKPAALPWLNQLCNYAGCKIGPYQRIEAIVVDASSLNKVKTDGKTEAYRLGVNLKNAIPQAVALPHIELSLNDAQDQSLLRRVLSPADLGANVVSLAANAEWTGAAAIQVDTTSLAGARIAGYRVLAFYP